jgi:hypothetical protein
MKKILLALVTLSGLGLSNLKAQAPTPDLFHYRFTPTGTAVVNYATTPPAGTATGTIIGAQTQTGNINCMNALVGTGVSSTSDYINTGWATNLSGAWTISFWTANNPVSSTLFYIFGDVNAGSFRCFTNGVAGTNNWIIRATGMTDVLFTGAATVAPNMVTLVYDAAAGMSTSYINGVQTGTTAQTAFTITGAGPFKVGGYSSSTGLGGGQNMADFRIYGSALTSTQVAAIYATTSLTAISASISGGTAACQSQIVQLTASGANTYSWSTGSTTNTTAVIPFAVNVYSVIATAGTCTSLATHTVSLSPSPTITVAGPSAICSGQSATLTASGATSYSWNTPANTASISVSPSSNTSYTVIGSSGFGCQDTVIKALTVNANPTITAVSSASLICVGQSATIIPSGATTYTYSSGSAVINPSVTTSYTVSGTAANTCTSSIMFTQNVSQCTGLNEFVENNAALQLAPNPTNGVLTIKTKNTDITLVVIVNSIGQLVVEKVISNQQTSVDLSGLPNGVYFVKALQGNKVNSVQKIVKY